MNFTNNQNTNQDSIELYTVIKNVTKYFLNDLCEFGAENATS